MMNSVTDKLAASKEKMMEKLAESKEEFNVKMDQMAETRDNLELNVTKMVNSKIDNFKDWQKKRNELVDYKFKDVDVTKFRDTGFCMLRKYGQMISAFTHYFLFIIFDIMVSHSLLTADTTVYTNVRAGGIAFAVFSGLNIAILGYNIFKGIRIILSDDISDAFVHHEAYRFRNILSYDVFCFFTQITAKRSIMDKIVLYVYDSIYQLPQLISVKVPQLVLMMIFREALHTFSSTDGRIPTSQTSAILKLVFLVLELGFRISLICFMAPLIKCCSKYKSVRDYANFLIETRVNSLVKSGKADLREEAQDESGCCFC